MRRFVFTLLGILETLAAVVLVVFAWQLPGRAEVEDNVGRVERVGKQARVQVDSLHERIALLEQRRPQMRALARRLQDEMRVVNDTMQGQHVDFVALATVKDALGDVAGGLDGLGETLDPGGVGKLGKGLETTANYLDRQVGPAADKAAADLERTAADLRANARALSALLRSAPVDLKAARDMHNSLSRFNEGLERLSGLLDVGRVETMREGFKGLETSLDTGAGQVEKLAGYSYPVVTFEGLKPVIEERAFWPEGAKIAEGMRKAGDGAKAASKQLDELHKDLPKLLQSLDESRKVVRTTRDALGTALKQQEKLEVVLKNTPEQAARLAEELPQLAGGLAKILRETAKLREVGGLLRQAQKGIDSAVARWPQLSKNLGRSATVLRNLQSQLNHILTHRADYEQSLQHSLVLSRTFAAALPLLTEQLELELEEQEQALASLGESIDEVNAALPACSQTATHILHTTKLLLLLVGAIFALHGFWLMVGTQKVSPTC
jgi:ABC-type transporter Mla subunit MlaD